MNPVAETLSIIWMAVTASWLFAGIVAILINGFVDGFFDRSTIKAARGTVLGFVWPLLILLLPVFLVVFGFMLAGHDPRDVRDNIKTKRDNKKHAHEQQLREQELTRECEARALKLKIRSLEHELGMPLSDLEEEQAAQITRPKPRPGTSRSSYRH